MTLVKPHYLPPLYQDAADFGRLILRDGSTAFVRVARPVDCEAVRDFFKRLSAESRRFRFFSPSKPPADELDALCRAGNPRDQLTLVVLRTLEGQPRVIAVASYFATDRRTAEVALAVDDTLHGRGLGSLLLERLALLATQAGFSRFLAVTHTDNRLMLEVFRRSGFALRETAQGGEITCEFSIDPTKASAERSEWLDRIFTVSSLHPLLNPRSVAVVGASREPASIGGRIFEALLAARFEGPVYPVNPRAEVVGSVRAYPTVRALPEPVDLAVLVVPRPALLSVVDDCAARGVRGLIVITAGLAETGEPGRALQHQLTEKVRGYGMRMIGPNCLGALNTDPSVRLNASFSPVYPPEGSVAMLSQSGALGIAILALARQLHLGLSSFVSVGNKADVSGNDLLQYWEQDPRTNVILLYLESFGNPRRFARIARRVSRAKPIIAVKGGRTTAGIRAAGSHTAALAASNVAVEALFQQTGVLRAETLEEMFDFAAAFASQPLPRGRRVAIVTNAGGPGILCADACEAGGLTLPEPSPATRACLAAFLPPAASLSNPIDMIASASPEHFERTVAAVLSAEDVDALIVLYIPVGTAHTEAIIRGLRRGIETGQAAAATPKPILTCLMAEETHLPPIQVGEARIPTYRFPEAAARALAKMAGYADWRRRATGQYLEFEGADLGSAKERIRKALEARGDGWLSAEEVRDVLAAAGLPLVESRVARTAEEASALARTVGFPVAVKLVSQTLLHKTEAGGVALNVGDEPGVRAAFEQIRGRVGPGAMDGVLVQPMVRGGVELLVGAVEDAAFGPLIAFGLGGVHVEVLGDVVFRIAPLTDQDAQEMVRAIRGFRLLAGYRDQQPADIEAIEQVLLRVSCLVDEIPEIQELDLNPVFALAPGAGCRIVDARLRVAAQAPAPSGREAAAPAPSELEPPAHPVAGPSPSLPPGA